MWVEPRRTGLKSIDKDHPRFCSAPCTGGLCSLDVQSERLHARPAGTVEARRTTMVLSETLHAS